MMHVSIARFFTRDKVFVCKVFIENAFNSAKLIWKVIYSMTLEKIYISSVLYQFRLEYQLYGHKNGQYLLKKANYRDGAEQ